MGEQRPSRRSIRLKGYDYRLPGGYFVTICVKDGLCVLGDVVDGTMKLSEIGRIVDEEWQKIGAARDYIELDTYCVMPNHFHGILWLTHEPQSEEHDLTWAKLASSDQLASPLRMLPKGATSGSLGAVLGSFKSTTTRRLNRVRGIKGISLWQRNFWERIIRNERKLKAIRQYIWNNPASWLQDEWYAQHKQ